MRLSGYLTQFLVWLFVAAPLFSYISYGLLGQFSSLYYYRPICLVVGLIFLIENRRKLVIPSVAVLLFLFFLFRLIWSAYYSQGSMELVKFVLKSNELAFASIFLIVKNSTFSDSFIQKLVKAAKITIVLAAIASVWQVVDFDFLNAWNIRYKDEVDLRRVMGGVSKNRRTSIYGFIDSNALGLSFIPLLSVLIGQMLRNENRRWAFFLVLGGLVATLSNARYIMVAFLIISAQVLFAKGLGVGNIIRYMLTGMIFLALLFFTLPFLGYDLQGWFESRLFAEGAITETTRFKAIGNFVIFFPEAPFFGTGRLTEEIREASNAIGSSHIHVGYLSHLVYYGIVGCTFLFGSWFVLWRELSASAKKTKFYGTFLAFLSFWWAFVTMSESSMFFGGLIIALVFDRYYLQQSEFKD